MSWFTERLGAGAAPTARPWVPLPTPTALGAGADCPPPPTPLLAFGESDLARIAAATSLQAANEARAGLAADPTMRLAEAIERMAEELAAAARRHAEADAAALRCAIALARAIARVVAPTAGALTTLEDRLTGLLATVGEPLTARLVVAASLAESLRPALPQIAARAGFTGTLELQADARLAEGAARLVWPGGWLELDPDALAARVAALLAAHASVPQPSSSDGSADASE